MKAKDTTFKNLFFTIVRIAIGWHFLYEGIAKIMADSWTAAPYLAGSKWIFDYDPEETVRYMESLKEPWIAFKVLAAGAIKPQDGLKYAFNKGADFVCMGMYDFQIVDDVNITLDTLKNVNERKRPWMA